MSSIVLEIGFLAFLGLQWSLTEIKALRKDMYILYHTGLSCSGLT